MKLSDKDRMNSDSIEDRRAFLMKVQTLCIVKPCRLVVNYHDFIGE